jgi:glycosyltransferase involved in cell wall biosynthesis
LGADNEFVPWSEHGEAERIGAAHVGIMPLPDTEFTRGKCGLKALQYMATGRPAVISPVGMNKDLVQHGVNGFLVGTVDETIAALDALAESPTLRRRVGLAGRRTIEQRYCAAIGADQFAAVVRRAVQRFPR